MSLGLADGLVRVVDHDVSWVAAYEKERRFIEAQLDGLGCPIEHVGSTSVPGLAAKPIVDIAVGVAASSETECVERLRAAGYEYRGYEPDSGHVLVRRAGEYRTHHLHVVPADGEQWRKYLVFREFLRRDAEACDAYRAAKQELAARFCDDRRAYTDGKDEIVAELLRRAEAAGVSA